MRIIRFTTKGSADVYFGVVVQNRAVSFDALQSKAGKMLPMLSNSRSYLENLPDSEKVAKELLAWGEGNIERFGASESYPLDSVRLLEPVEVTSLFDFGLTPRHLKNSAEVIGRYEKDNPQTASLLKAFAKAVMAPKAKAPEGQPEALSYHKGNMNTIVGDNESIPWPVRESLRKYH